jgi:hypothetical protein
MKLLANRMSYQCYLVGLPELILSIVSKITLLSGVEEIGTACDSTILKIYWNNSSK